MVRERSSLWKGHCRFFEYVGRIPAYDILYPDNTYVEATGIPREEIFLTSKLKNNAGYEEALTDLKNSLKRSGVEYFDLYLMHSAIGGPVVRKNVWKALCDAQSQGLIKSIGVSNFGKKHIQEFIDQKVPLPTVNQVDLHPFMRHPEIVEICEQNEILLEAWGPLARAMKFDHPVLVKIAKEKGKDAAQIMLRWGIQHVRPNTSFIVYVADVLLRASLSSPSLYLKSESSPTPRSLTLSSLPRR